MPSAEDILRKYSSRIESELDSSDVRSSKDYQTFKQDMLQEMGSYEKWAGSLGSIFAVKLAERDRSKIQKELDIAHVEVTAGQAVMLSIVSMLAILFGTTLLFVGIYFITGSFPSLLLFFLGLVVGAFVFYYTYGMPRRLAEVWKLKASSEMVPAILYTVIYMKHTSNLEKAVQFTAEHLEGPLGLDFKKIFYDVEIGKYSTIKQSLDSYLEKWSTYAPEFVEAFHLIESSLYEPSDARRIQILEKSLQVILDGVYEKMLKYSREIRSPLTNLYMLGIILPTLGLALLPLASTLLGGAVQWPMFFVFFDIIIPFFVFYMVNEVLLKRPGGYGESSVLELSPDYYRFTSRKAWAKSFLIAFPLLLIGIIPLLFQIPGLAPTLGLHTDYTFGELGIPLMSDTKIFDFKCSSGGQLPCPPGDSLTGPFGAGGILLSLFIPLSIMLFFSLAYSYKTKELIKSRERTKNLEEEFTNSLFQLGNRLGDGIPAEIVFARVAESTQGQTTHDFFSLTNQNIQEAGMSIERAVFDKSRGSITFFPSPLIATSMRILIESVKKGLHVAAESLMSISDYIKNINKINQRLKDLLAEIISDMKSNMTFLAPLLAGIVIGLSSMITTILLKLDAFTQLGAGDQQLAGFSMQDITNIFDVKQMIPPFYLQIIVGIYLIEIVFILTKALVTVDAGRDPLREKNELARNLSRGILLYLVTALISIVALTILASIALQGLAG